MSFGFCVPCLAVELAAGLFLASATPLLEEEGYPLILASVANRAYPFDLRWSRSRPALATNNCPLNAVQIGGTYGSEQWFE